MHDGSVLAARPATLNADGTIDPDLADATHVSPGATHEPDDGHLRVACLPGRKLQGLVIAADVGGRRPVRVRLGRGVKLSFWVPAYEAVSVLPRHIRWRAALYVRRVVDVAGIDVALARSLDECVASDADAIVEMPRVPQGVRHATHAPAADPEDVVGIQAKVGGIGTNPMEADLARPAARVLKL